MTTDAGGSCRGSARLSAAFSVHPMRISLLCMKCGPGVQDIELKQATRVEFEDSGLYRLTCEHGHETVSISHNLRFEVLFEIGAFAIVDRYYREAVSSFTAALERFYEFYVRVQARAHGVLPDDFERSWGNVKSQSERQFGAFVLAYLFATKAPPRTLDRKQVEFRNDVVHKGRIPSRQEAIEYGESILEMIVPMIDELGQLDALDQEKQAQHTLLRKQVPAGTTVVKFLVGTLLSASIYSNGPPKTLQQWIDIETGHDK